MEKGKLEDLSKYRLEKAKKNLESVPYLIKGEFYNFAANRSYYAAFDAMRAVNALDRFDSSKHSGVIAHFNQHYVKTGKFKPESSTIIKKASSIREKSDYEDFYETTKDEAEEILKLVKVFVYEVENYLKEQNIII